MAARRRKPAPRVYLHVGEPKCGTTFLQDIVWGNRRELARQGVLLPGLAAQDQFRATQDLREVPQRVDDPGGAWTGEWDILARQARRADRAALISHELLAGADREQATRAVRSLHPAEVHIVLTVRDLASLLPAEWQETVKHRNQRPWDRWLDAITNGPGTAQGRARWFWRAHDTLDVLRRWSELVPPDRVHVVTVPPPGSPPDLLWQRFAGVVGLDAGTVDISAARPNASLGLPEVELLRRLNRRLGEQLPEWFYAAHVKETLAHRVLAERPRSGRLQLPPERQAWSRERADELIAGLRSSGYDIVGDLDDLRPRPAREGGPTPEDVTDAQLLDAALGSLAALLRTDDEAVSHRSGQRFPAGRLGAALAGSDRTRRALRDLSSRHPSVARLCLFALRTAGRAPGAGAAGR